MPNLVGSSTQRIPMSNSSQQSSPTKPKLHTTSSASPLKDSLKDPQKESSSSSHGGDRLVEKSPAGKDRLPSISRIPVRREPPSVADLRKSFEKGSQPPKGAPQTPSKSKPLAEKTPDRAARDSKEVPRSSGSTGRGNTPSVRTIARDKATSVQAPPSIAGRTPYPVLNNKPSEQSLLVRNAIDTIKHAPRVSLPKSSRFRQRDAHNLDGAASFDQDGSVEPDEASLTDASRFPGTGDSKDFPFPDLIHPFLTTSSMRGLRSEMRSDRPLIHEEVGPQNIDRFTQKPASKSGGALRCTGKVSDLRRLFERTPTRCASPNPFKSFWQNRSRNKPKVETEEVLITRYDQAGSPTTSTTHSSPPKRISLPELTTSISINDFSCDFAVPEALGNASSIKHKARFDIELDENMSPEQESPVKGRIQQFEHLERGSPTPSTASIYRAKLYNADAGSSPRGKENDAKHVKNRTSWRPFRQRSVELWRRISNSFVRSVEEQAGPSNHAHLDGTWSSSLPRRPRYRRSDIFSYHLYRSSEVTHSPTTSHSRSSVSNDDDLVARVENLPPHRTYKRSPSRDISISKTFPFLARISDSLGGSDEFGDFGFDGSILSKATRYRTKLPTGKIPQSSSSPNPRGDPTTLSKVVSQQTVAERKRRRLEEKQVRQELRHKKREEKAKAKGKEKATGEKRSEDEEETAATRDKGKGKEVEGKKRESSWTKKTASGFVVRQINDVKLRHPKPRRPGQVKKLVNMYKEKASSGIKLGKGSGASSGSGAGAAGPANH